MAAVAPGDCAISTITADELYTGVEKCAKPAQERSKVELLLTTVWEMPFDPDAARESARVRALLESLGQAIGPYDVLLAGQCEVSEHGGGSGKHRVPEQVRVHPGKVHEATERVDDFPHCLEPLSQRWVLPAPSR
jgi:hypothetical protein